MSDSLRDQLQTTLGAAYTLERELGGGGMSRVFVAREHGLGRDVVIKVLAHESAQAMSAERFLREIQLAAALQDPYIVPVHSAGQTAEGLPFYTMPYVRGESLRARMSAGPLPRNEAVAILRDVARALAYAHGRNVVHRDVKPENILLSSGGTAVVTDFGIAKAISSARAEGRRTGVAEGTSALTSHGVSLGTPAYMSPEQASGDPDVDHRADLYAWGVVAWELLSGRHPFADRSTMQQLIAAQISATPPPLTTVGASLGDLVMRCLEKDPSARVQSAFELIAGLDAAMVIGTPSRRRSKRGMILGAVAVAVLVSIAGVTWLVRDRTRTVATRPARSVGVTPFVNLRGSDTDDYFSEGVAQELADALGRVPGLRVAFHNPAVSPGAGATQADPRMLGRALGVETVLQGTVQRSGNRVRVTARLVNTDDGFQLWSETFDRQIADVFALQDEVARAIAGGLQFALAPGGRDTLVRVTTTDPEAHLLYLEGMYFWNRRGAANIYKSVTLFERAVERDPGFARAWAGIALAYAIVVTWDDVDVTKTLARATAAANRSLALDSTTSDAWTAIAEAKSSLWQNAEASSAFERAIQVDPNNATAHQWYGEHLGRVGRYDEGLAHVRRAQQLAPLSLVVNTQEGRLELQSRRFPQARAALRHVLELDSTYRTAHTLMGAAFLQEGDRARALTSFRRALELSGTRRSLDVSFLAHAYGTIGQPDSARALLAELDARRRAGEPISFAGLALVHESLGDRERALSMLDTAVSRYDAVLGMHATEAVFDPLRRDPRGARILAPVVTERRLRR